MGNRSLVLLLVLVSLVVVSCTGSSSQPGASERVELVTSDGVRIIGSYYPSQSESGVLLLHMLGRDRHSFDGLARELSGSYQVLSIDLRGHGESDGDFRSFSEDDFRNMVLDVEAAAGFLAGKGVVRVSVVGASIGANTALRYASVHPVERLVLLSPGKDYRGIDISSITYDKPLLVLVSRGDEYSFSSVEELRHQWRAAVVKVYDGSLHGTDIIRRVPGAREEVLSFLS